MHTNRPTPASEARADRIFDHVRAVPEGLVSTYGDCGDGIASTCTTSGGP
jgi:alkylated DNA nucleotide flippase Atl1